MNIDGRQFVTLGRASTRMPHPYTAALSIAIALLSGVGAFGAETFAEVVQRAEMVRSWQTELQITNEIDLYANAKLERGYLYVFVLGVVPTSEDGYFYPVFCTNNVLYRPSLIGRGFDTNVSPEVARTALPLFRKNQRSNRMLMVIASTTNDARLTEQQCKRLNLELTLKCSAFVDIVPEHIKIIHCPRTAPSFAFYAEGLPVTNKLGQKQYRIDDAKLLASERSGVIQFAWTNYYQEALVRVATTAASYKDREAAVRALTNDHQILATVALKDAHPWVRRAAVDQLDDQAVLTMVALNDVNPWVRTDAVCKIDDQALLAKIAMKDVDADVLVAAAKRMTNQAVLASMVTNSVYPEVRSTAVSRLTDQAALCRIVLEHADAAYRAKAVEKVTAQDVLGKVALADKASNVRLAAVARLTNHQVVLTEIAVQDDTPEVSSAAVMKLASQSALARVAWQSKHWDVRKQAFQRLSNTNVLLRIAGNQNDPALALAANIRLGKTSWSGVAWEDRSGNLKPGIVIGAMALFEKQRAIADAVEELCLNYIRKGDIGRVPELLEVLKVYGSKPLAEDYLNCGHKTLELAAKDWAKAHGFNIDTGYGSSRARWGESKGGRPQ